VSSILYVIVKFLEVKIGWAHVWVMGGRKPQDKRSNVGSRINCVGAFM